MQQLSGSDLHGTEAGGRKEPLARIVVTFDGDRIDERVLLPGRLVVGRTTDNDLQIDSKYVSRHHCQIVTTRDGSTLEDLNSTNGVYIKSKRVRRHHLNDGDVVVLGRHEILYVDERTARQRAASRDMEAATAAED